MFDSLQRESHQLLNSVIALIYFMRGAVSYSEAMNMSYTERQVIDDYLERRLDVEKKNPYPVY